MLRRRRLVFISFAVVQLSTLLLLLASCSAEENVISTTNNHVNQLRRLPDKGSHLLNINKFNKSNLLREENTNERRTSSTRNKIEKQFDNSVKQDIISVMEEQEMKSNSILGDTDHVHQQASSDPYKSVHRQTRDVEDIFNEMAHKEPQEWTVIDWIALFVFLTMFCWIYSCLCALCCCGRRVGGGGSSLLNWLCFYEICCRDGRDLDVCCDYAAAII